MPVQQGMNFGGTGSGDNKRKSAGKRFTTSPAKETKATREPSVEPAVTDAKKNVGGSESLKHEKPERKPTRRVAVDKPRRKPEVKADDGGKSDETRDMRSAKEVLASREFAESKEPKSRRGLIIGLAIAAGVFAIFTVVLVVVNMSQRSVIDEPITEPTYENADHKDGNAANSVNTASSDVDITGFIDTGDGFSYQYPSFADSDAVELVGKIRNDTDKDVASVGINFFLYDDKGVLIGTAADGTDVVKAGAEWEFHAKCATDVKRASVARFLIDQLQFGDLDVTSSIANEGAGITNKESAASDAAKAEEAAKAAEAKATDTAKSETPANQNGNNAGSNAVDPTANASSSASSSSSSSATN